jgi:hypothetical protein
MILHIIVQLDENPEYGVPRVQHSSARSVLPLLFRTFCYTFRISGVIFSAA